LGLEDNQYYPCQVLKLELVGDHSSDELRVPAPGSTSLLASLSRRFRFRDFYLQFNSSLNHVLNNHYYKHAHCAGSMETFMTSEASAVDASSLDSEDCKSPCMPSLNQSLSNLVETNGRLWREFLAAAPGDEAPESERAEYGVVKNFFAARVLFVAEFLARVSLTCTANYLGLSCNWVFGMRPHVKQCSALSSSHSPGQALEVFGSWLSFRVGTGDGCRAECNAEVQAFVYESQCCSQRIENAQRIWAAFVLPFQKDLVLDVSTYKCVYRRAALSPTSSLSITTQNCSQRKADLVALHVPESMSEKCESKTSGAGVISLQCALPACSLAPALELGEACCNPLQCSNKGTRSYLGVCFCDCPPPFAGATCSREVSQVRAAIAIASSHYVTLKRELVLEAFAEATSVPVSSVEIGHVRLLGSSSRRAPADQVLVPRNLKSYVYACEPAHLLNLQQALDVGFRVVGMSTPLDVMRMVQILVRGMNSRNVQRMLQKRGLALKGEGYLVPPTPYMPGGKVCSFIFVCVCLHVNCMFGVCTCGL